MIRLWSFGVLEQKAEGGGLDLIVIGGGRTLAVSDLQQNSDEWVSRVLVLHEFHTNISYNVAKGESSWHDFRLLLPFISQKTQEKEKSIYCIN